MPSLPATRSNNPAVSRLYADMFFRVGNARERRFWLAIARKDHWMDYPVVRIYLSLHLDGVDCSPAAPDTVSKKGKT